MANEDVLISIKLEGSENEAKINQYTQSITSLQKANQDLINSNKELAKQGQENSKAYLDNAKQIEINKQKISENTASRKGLINAIISEDNSIKGLQVKNAELIRQRNAINISTEAGQKRIAAINAQLDANNAKIRENSSALEKQKINIGNYASALDGVVPGLGGFIQGMQGATAASKAFIATPIGVVLGAVAAGLALVSTFFTKISTGADFLEDALSTISTTFEVLTGRAARFVEGLISLANGEFAKGFDQLKASISGVGDEIINETRAVRELNAAFRELEDTEIDFSIKQAEIENQIKRLVLQSRNRKLTEEERIAKLNEALALEKQMNEEALKNAEELIRIESEKAALILNLEREKSETTIAFGKRVIEAFKADGASQDDAARKRVQDALIAFQQVEGASIGIQEKIQNQRDALDEKQEARIQKETEELLKKRTLELEDIDIQTELGEKKIQLNTSFNEAILQTNEAFRKKDVENKKQQDKLILASEAAKQKGIQELQMMALSFGFQIAGQNKALQSALTLTSTYFSAQKAYESQFLPVAEASSPIRGAIAAAIAVASGLARVAAINGINFGGAAAGGGEFLTKGPTMLLVGDNPGGVERVSVTPISGKGKTVVGNGLVQMAGGGSFTAMGEMRSAISQAKVQTILVLEDFEAKQLSKYETLNQAQVL